MVRTFIVLLIIFFTNQRSTAIFPLTITNLETIIAWGNSIFEEETSHGDVKMKFDNTSIQRLETVFPTAGVIAEQLNIYSNKISELHFKSFHQIDKIHDNYLQIDKSTLNDLILTVDRFYDNGADLIKLKKQSTNKQFKSFVQMALWNPDNLRDTLDRIHQLILPSNQILKPEFLQLIIDDLDMNLSQDCDKYISAQQYMLFIYGLLVIAEMKGLTTLKYAYLINQRTDKSSGYMNGIKTSRRKFEKRIKNYHKQITKAMNKIPRVIYRCEIDTPQRGINFIEFIKYQQITAVSISPVGVNGSRTYCADLNHKSKKYSTRQQLYDCEYFGSNKDVSACLAEPDASRKYLWIETPYHLYGRKAGQCPELIKVGGNQAEEALIYVCLCSTIEPQSKFNNSILRISVTPQISDIQNHMIVVGVKFIEYDHAIHLQIQQSKFFPNSIVENSTEWKRLDDHKSSTTDEFQYHSLFDFSGQLFIDDVMLPPKYVVTGVRFTTRSKSPQGFHLEVHGTPFDPFTGELDSTRSLWFFPEHWNYLTTSDYKRNRIEITMNDPDDSSRCSGYNYNRETNKFIRFRHSSVSKDAGQSVVPFIDAQPVEAHPPFPLSGIGLFYREKEGCGGYIAPSIYTLNVLQST